MAEQTFADKEFCNQSGDVTNMPSMVDKTNKLLICRKDENSFENFKLFFSQSDCFQFEKTFMRRRLRSIFKLKSETFLVCKYENNMFPSRSRM